MGIRKAFSLLELIVVTTIISIIMAASAPRVDRWATRYRADAFIKRLLADVADAKALARTTGGIHNAGGLISLRRHATAIRFDAHAYQIMQAAGGALWNTWDLGSSNYRVVKSVPYPSGVSIPTVSTNGKLPAGGTSHLIRHPQSSPTPIEFLSTGSVTDVNHNALTAVSESCGGPIAPSIFYVDIDVALKMSGTLHYRVFIQRSGNYFVCSADDGDFAGSGQIVHGF